MLYCSGENVLAIVGGIANSPYLADPAEYRHGRVIFLDFLGHFMIVYPIRLGTVINTVTILVVMGWIGNKLFQRGDGEYCLAGHHAYVSVCFYSISQIGQCLKA